VSIVDLAKRCGVTLRDPLDQAQVDVVVQNSYSRIREA
jgi:hypothetical protein